MRRAQSEEVIEGMIYLTDSELRGKVDEIEWTAVNVHNEALYQKKAHEVMGAELANGVQRAIRSKLDMRADHDRVRAGFELEDTLTEEEEEDRPQRIKKEEVEAELEKEQQAEDARIIKLMAELEERKAQTTPQEELE